MKLKPYLITRTEWSGYDCSGHEVKHLVYAESKEEARRLIPRDDLSEQYGEDEELFELPDVSKKRKPFIVF